MWAPVYLSPVLGSPERLVVAVAAASGGDFHIEAANQLKRLQCLYGSACETALFATQVALEELRGALAGSGQGALKEGAVVFSGVTIGEVLEGEARSTQDLARTWMRAMSSLYLYAEALPMPDNIADLDDRASGSQDRLPSLVLDHVRRVAPPLSSYFSEEIRASRRRRVSSRIAGISIDYGGPKFVANFATLQASAQAHSLDRIKRKMFDLKVRRDADYGLFPARAHEMVIFSPPPNNPILNEKQSERLSEALDELGSQAKSEEFGFASLHDVAAIGDRLLRAEAMHA
jgi:hypothetical protein